MSIEYEDIQLKLVSSFDKKGVTNAISNLQELKGIFPMSGVKETASDMREFAAAINSIKSDAIRALASLKGSLSKAVKELKNKDNLINIPAKITIADKPKDNLIELPLEEQKAQIQMIDLAKERAKEQASAIAEANAEIAKQTEYYSELDAIVKRAVERSNHGNPVNEDLNNKWIETTIPYENIPAAEIERAMEGAASATREAYNELRAYLELYPKTKESYLKNELGFDKATIDRVKSDMYMEQEDAKRAAAAELELAEAANEAAKEQSKLADSVEKVGKSAQKSISPMQKLINKFKNFLQYRAMRAVWSAFVNGAKEGIKNLEDWDRSTGMTGFADAIDTARESFTVLKNSLAVIVAPGLEFLVGLLRSIAQGAMIAANSISRLMAILGGKSTYRAVKWADTVASSQSKAGSAAKKTTEEFKKQLMSFDEINNITAQNPTGSGGGGGGGSSGGFTEMFEERSVGDKSDFGYFSKWIGILSEKLASIKQRAQDFWDALKKAFEKVDYKELLDGLGHMGLAILVLIDDTLKWGEAFVKTEGFAKGLQITIDLIGAIFKGAAGMVYTFETAVKVTVAAVQWLADVTGAFFRALWDSLTGKKDAWANFDAEVAKAGDLFRGRVTSAVNELSSRLDYVTGKTYRINIEMSEVQRVTRYITETTSNIGKNAGAYYTKYASGGFPTQGQMFIAREAGPELVGTIGGQSAVVNNNDIVASVSQGVAQAVAAVMGGGQQVNVTLEGDAKGLFRVVQRESRAYSARTGQLAMT